MTILHKKIMFISYGKDAVNKTLSLSLNAVCGVLFMASYFFCPLLNANQKGDKKWHLKNLTLKTLTASVFGMN